MGAELILRMEVLPGGGSTAGGSRKDAAPLWGRSRHAHRRGEWGPRGPGLLSDPGEGSMSASVTLRGGLGVRQPLLPGPAPGDPALPASP